MTDAPELIWTSKNGKQIVSADMNIWVSDIQYARKELLDAATARAEAAERREKALLATNQEHRDDLVLSTSLRRRAEKAEAEVARLREALEDVRQAEVKGKPLNVRLPEIK